MSRKNESMDLCTNCMNIQKCFYYENKTMPIHFCEEFTCKEGAESLNEIKRLERAENLFLPKTKPRIFDDCGQAVKRS